MSTVDFGRLIKPAVPKHRAESPRECPTVSEKRPPRPRPARPSSLAIDCWSRGACITFLSSVVLLTEEDHVLRIAFYASRITHHVSRFTFHAPRVTRHASPVTLSLCNYVTSPHPYLNENEIRA